MSPVNRNIASLTQLRTAVLVLVGTLALCLSATAGAVMVTVEPDDFADGTDISNAFAGVTLSTVTTEDASSGAVYSRTDGAASTGSRTFGNDFTSGIIDQLVWLEGNGFGNPPVPGPVLRADFAAPTDFVAIDIINQDSFDGGIMRAFDADGNQIASDTAIVTSQFGIAPAPVVLSITRALADIAYITVAGQSAQDPVHLDFLRFNRVVPEPVTALLLLTGLGLTARRRRG